MLVQVHWASCALIDSLDQLLQSSKMVTKASMLGIRVVDAIQFQLLAFPASVFCFLFVLSTLGLGQLMVLAPSPCLS